ncbi:MAG: Uma2 family endonuclease [Candidatus Sumerlaeota bacterium]|nr:Uma2 family endonuclease [Candidatus Sumerlaeota bacterium]
MALSDPNPAMTAYTAEDFWQFASKDDYWGELIEGEVFDLTPPGFEHGMISGKITKKVGHFAEINKLGEILTDCGFILTRNPDSVRAPDVSFIRAEKIAKARTPRFSEIPPDLAVEVISPSDSYSAVVKKARMYLQAGVEEVWIVSLSTRTIEIFRSLTESKIIDEFGAIESPLLPGLSLPVREIFE